VRKYRWLGGPICAERDRAAARSHRKTYPGTLCGFLDRVLRCLAQVDVERRRLASEVKTRAFIIFSDATDGHYLVLPAIQVPPRVMSAAWLDLRSTCLLYDRASDELASRDAHVLFVQRKNLSAVSYQKLRKTR